ncbi:unnamed protein product [Blepharisma stoltei]|uniref:Uncharacterized protein n=1 Tax=Blepharisma stoltei TaxID=1481888 RepID=A0AAU9J456_9CILI|nr:unnamed protein product [Blepharisma stoltei]
MCESDIIKVIFYSTAGGIWTIYFIYWIINTYIKNIQHIKPLHKIITFIVIFKMMNVDFAALQSFTCRDTSDLYPYWSLGYTSTYTLYNTFLYTSFILISKGFCVTRELLDRTEVTVIAMTMGLSYLGFSAYMIQQMEFSFFLIVMIFVFFHLNVKYTIENIKSLQDRYNILRNANLPGLLSSYMMKINMLKFYLLILHIFFIEELSVILAVEIGEIVLEDSTLRYSDYINIPDEIFESIGIMIILFIFKAKDRGQLFFLSIYQDETEDQRPAPFLSARLPLGHDEAFHEENPAIVLCPQEFNPLKPYKSVMLGIPYIHHVPLSEESD